jgi:hypothetical protein
MSWQFEGHQEAWDSASHSIWMFPSSNDQVGLSAMFAQKRLARKALFVWKGLWNHEQQ